MICCSPGSGLQCQIPRAIELPFIAEEYKRFMDGIEGNIEITSISQTPVTIMDDLCVGHLSTEVTFKMPIIRFLKNKPKYKERPYPYDNEAEKNKILKAEFYDTYGDNVIGDLDYELKMKALEEKLLDGGSWEYVFFKWSLVHRMKELENKRQFEGVKKCRHGYYRESDFELKEFSFTFNNECELSQMIESEATMHSQAYNNQTI